MRKYKRLVVCLNRSWQCGACNGVNFQNRNRREVDSLEVEETLEECPRCGALSKVQHKTRFYWVCSICGESNPISMEKMRSVAADEAFKLHDRCVTQGCFGEAEISRETDFKISAEPAVGVCVLLGSESQKKPRA